MWRIHISEVKKGKNGGLELPTGGRDLKSETG